MSEIGQVNKDFVLCVFTETSSKPGAQPVGHLPPPPTFSKHCIAILTFAETFKK